MRRTLTALASLALTVTAVTAAAPAHAAGKFVVVLGDSYAGGSSMDSGRAARWPALLAARDGFTVRVDAVGGSGFTVDGQRADGSFPEQATRILKDARVPDVVVIMAARNDIHQSATGTVGPAAVKTLNTIHTLAPNARVLLVGPVWAGEVTPFLYKVFATNEWNATKTAGAAYVDGSTQPGPWFKGHPEMIGTDRVHPNDAGHKLMADKINPKLKVALG